MTFSEGIAQFFLAGSSVVAATLIGRRSPFLGALVLTFPIKVLTTLLFLPHADKEIASRFLLALVPGLLTVIAFALAARAVLHKLPILHAYGVGLLAWFVAALALAFGGRSFLS